MLIYSEHIFPCGAECFSLFHISLHFVYDSTGLRNQNVLCLFKRDSAKTFEKLLAAE